MCISCVTRRSTNSPRRYSLSKFACMPPSSTPSARRRSVTGSLLGAIALMGATHPIALPAQERPSLAVLIVVDQLRPDYIPRFQSQLTGGLARFWNQGTFFTDARQDHAITETAPGHSTLLSGRPPASTGIVANSRGVPDSTSPLIDVVGDGASPWRFRGTTLYDWMQARDPKTQALSVSRKDRGAILPIGRARNAQVYWYRQGKFTTSRWYAAALPDWLRGWNARRGPARLTGQRWDLLLSHASYPEPDSAPYENHSKDITFPHRLPLDTVAALDAVEATPCMDSLIADVALTGMEAMRLGRRGSPDLLVISFSATDNIGHQFGPDSREIHDQILRLDRLLARFMDSLAVLVPGPIVYALAADHGVQSFPEQNGRGGRIGTQRLRDSLRRELAPQSATALTLRFDSGLLSGNVKALKASGVDIDSLARVTAARVRARPGVTQVYTPATLSRAPASSECARLWRRVLPPDEQWLVASCTAPGWIFEEGPGETGHGTVAVEDMRIPVAFLGPGISPARIARRITSEDVGPTFAALLGVRPTEPVVGKPLREVTSASQ